MSATLERKPLTSLSQVENHRRGEIQHAYIGLIKTAAKGDMAKGKALEEQFAIIEKRGLTVDIFYGDVANEVLYISSGGDNFEKQMESQLEQLNSVMATAKANAKRLEADIQVELRTIRVISGANTKCIVQHFEGGGGQKGQIYARMREWRQWKALNPRRFSDNTEVAMSHNLPAVSLGESSNAVQHDAGLAGQAWIVAKAGN